MDLRKVIWLYQTGSAWRTLCHQYMAKMRERAGYQAAAAWLARLRLSMP